MLVKKAGDVRIHTFIAGFTENNIANATHIIENTRTNKLVLIDAQFLATYAEKFRAFAEGLGKSIERIYLSHRHPDHWFGLGTAFSDGIQIYSLPETRDFIQEHGDDSVKDHAKKMGPEAPKGTVVPQNVLEFSNSNEVVEDVIDGVRYHFRRHTNTEIDYLLTISLPDLGVYFAQDLIYSGTHLYLYAQPERNRVPGSDLTRDMEHWIEVLGELLRSDYDLFMPGHGFPADKVEVAKNIEYLSEAKYVIDNGLTKYDFKYHMLQRYPDRKCPGIFDTYLPRLFDNTRDY
jgi:glyoxylase-like metal-dependent hydrolase (beta-lactamase superfamily II)